MRLVCFAQARTSPATAAAAIITMAYSAVLWPASEGSERRSNVRRTLDSNCNTFDLQVDGRTRGACEMNSGKAGAGASASDPGDDRRNHREQREGGQNTTHEREAESHGNCAGT